MEIKKVKETAKIKDEKMFLAEKEAKLSPAGREIWEGIKEGLEDVKHGRVRPASEFLKELKELQEKEQWHK